MKMHLHLASAFATMLLASSSPALELASVFTDHMVLQQGMEVPVWGKATPDESVTITFAGQKASAKSGADGKWLAKSSIAR